MNLLIRLLFISISITSFSVLQAQDTYRQWFSYLNPRPGAQYVMPEHSISFRLDRDAAPELLQATVVELQGSHTGPIAGDLHMASDGRTVIVEPSKTFSPGEAVTCTMRFHPALGIPDFTSSFTISTITKAERKKALESIRARELEAQGHAPMKAPATMNGQKAMNDTLPEGFPQIDIVKWDNPSEGYIFVSPLNYEENTFFEIIVDNHATPVFYREVPAYGAMDFKLQPNGYLTAFLTSEVEFIVMDPQFRVVDTIAGGNGYEADIHELRYYDDMHAFLLCYDPQLVDMSQVVPGGQPDAVVIGLIVQELDENKDVVFEWSSWDHYEITDVSNWIDLTASTIDYVHGNSIEVVNDSVMMICSRNMNEVTKIDRNTGDILWRLNGEQNMFEFIPPADSFCVQHSIRMMPDSVNISIFDNGSCWVPPYSSAVEYILDEEAMTATLVERLRSDPDIHGPFMGNTQRMLNGHTINGWGKGVPSVTEFDADGEIVLELSFPQLNYRAFKYDWHHAVFNADPQQVDFGTIDVQDSAAVTITLTNTFDTDIVINRMVNRTPAYTLTDVLPLTIPAGGSAELEVMFKPGSSQEFKDDLTFCWDIDSDTLRQRIAVQVHATGAGTDNQGVADLEAGGIRVFPSPFKDKLSIRSEEKIIASVSIMTLNGETVHTATGLGSREVDLSVDLASGTYLLVIVTEDDGERFLGKIVGNQ